MKNIIFYGPLGKLGSTIVGGSETGNWRTIELLEKKSDKVIPIRKPYHISRNFLGEVIYIFHLFFFHLYFFLKVISIKKPKVVHICGYYFNMIYFEYFMLLLSKMAGAKVVYEIRAGGLINSFTSRNSIYKLVLRKLLQNSSIIMTQGASDIEFIKKLTNTPIFHYPNYIKDDLMPIKINKKRHESNFIEIVYFGRISPQKNILFIIEVCSILKKKGIAFKLEMIGGPDKMYSKANDRNYIDIIKEKVETEDLGEFVSFLPPQNQQSLFKILQSKHFFLFPSIEPREGHSNALTEAMACGVVPLVSLSGFNRSVVGNDSLVIESYHPELYAKALQEIWINDQWEDFSLQMRNRVKDNFTETIVSRTLFSAYNHENLR